MHFVCDCHGNLAAHYNLRYHPPQAEVRIGRGKTAVAVLGEIRGDEPVMMGVARYPRAFRRAVLTASRIGALILLAAGTNACASIFDGKSQQIAINTNPTGAECGLYRQGLRIATVQSSPGMALIEKSKHDIWVVCVKSGYQMSTYFNHSGVAGATYANVLGGILTGGIAWGIDSASGADNKYDSPVNISMPANSPDQPPGPTTLPASYTMGDKGSGSLPPPPPGAAPANPAPVAPAPAAPAAAAPAASASSSSPPAPSPAAAPAPASTDVVPSAPAPSSNPYQSRFRI